MIFTFIFGSLSLYQKLCIYSVISCIKCISITSSATGISSNIFYACPNVSIVYDGDITTGMSPSYMVLTFGHVDHLDIWTRSHGLIEIVPVLNGCLSILYNLQSWENVYCSFKKFSTMSIIDQDKQETFLIIMAS